MPRAGWVLGSGLTESLFSSHDYGYTRTEDSTGSALDLCLSPLGQNLSPTALTDPEPLHLLAPTNPLALQRFAYPSVPVPLQPPTSSYISLESPHSPPPHPCCTSVIPHDPLKPRRSFFLHLGLGPQVWHSWGVVDRYGLIKPPRGHPDPRLQGPGTWSDFQGLSWNELVPSTMLLVLGA